MAKPNYKINPVKATCMRCDADGGCGIHSYNDTCFNICAAYSGTYDTYAVDSDCAKACSDMIEEKRHQFYGVGSCDHQQPYRPVIWDETPAYFVKLLNDGIAPKDALKESKKLCEMYSSNLASECIEKQVNLFNALESSSPTEATKPSQNSQKNYTKKPIQGKLPKENSPKPHSKNNLVSHVLIVLSVLILVSAVVVLVKK